MRRTSENQLVIESQQVEEPGWAGPEQVAWGTPLDYRGAGDAGQKLHFGQEGKGDLSGKWKVTEGSLSGQWERQRWFLTKAFAHVFGISQVSRSILCLL